MTTALGGTARTMPNFFLAFCCIVCYNLKMEKTEYQYVIGFMTFHDNDLELHNIDTNEQDMFKVLKEWFCKNQDADVEASDIEMLRSRAFDMDAVINIVRVR